MQKAVIEIITHKDDPAGLKSITVGGKLIQSFVIPRVDISDMAEFDSIDNPGVYFLINETEEEKFVYVGQSNNILRRLTQQKQDKDDWTVAIAFTAGQEINALFLEKMCIEEVNKSSRYKTNNKTGAPGNPISKSAEIINQQYMDEIKFITSLLGYHIFGTTKSIDIKSKYYINSKGINATGIIMAANDFLVFKGSEAVLDTVPSFSVHVKSSENLRNKLIEEKTLYPAGNRYIFSKDYIFSSPSSAADVIRGMATNGWTTWKDQSGKNLDENLRKGKF